MPLENINVMIVTRRVSFLHILLKGYCMLDSEEWRRVLD
jgi:hypothetical protein